MKRSICRMKTSPAYLDEINDYEMSLCIFTVVLCAIRRPVSISVHTVNDYMSVYHCILDLFNSQNSATKKQFRQSDYYGIYFSKWSVIEVFLLDDNDKQNCTFSLIRFCNYFYEPNVADFESTLTCQLSCPVFEIQVLLELYFLVNEFLRMS